MKYTTCYRHDAGERDGNQLCIDDLQDVFSLLINAEKSWFCLGLTLHVKLGTLEGIRSKESCNTDRLCEMLAHWLRSSSSRTWSDIYNGLRSDTVKQDVLADKIEEKYKGIDICYPLSGHCGSNAHFLFIKAYSVNSVPVYSN